MSTGQRGNGADGKMGDHAVTRPAKGGDPRWSPDGRVHNPTADRVLSDSDLMLDAARPGMPRRDVVRRRGWPGHPWV